MLLTFSGRELSWEARLDDTTPVAIIGAGPAGLAVAACLRQAGLDFILLEKERQAAPAWRRHYERVHLHTTKRYSSLPFVPFPKHYPRYVPRDLLVEYLDAYAQRFDLRPRFGETVQAVTREGRGWRVDATSGPLRAKHVVIASGYNAEPLRPGFAGIDTFTGKTLHSADYRNATPFAGQSVLVIGMATPAPRLRSTWRKTAQTLRFPCAAAFISCRANCSACPSRWSAWRRGWGRNASMTFSSPSSSTWCWEGRKNMGSNGRDKDCCNRLRSHRAFR